MQNYAELINGTNDLTMKKIISIATECAPAAYRNHAWDYYTLNHGTAILADEDSLNCYLAAYGIMHMVKMMSALKYLPTSAINGNYEIIDWGCGQGLASICLLDMIEHKNNAKRPSRITFVDASNSALKRAKLHAIAKLHNSNTEIHCVNANLSSTLDKHAKFHNNSTIIIHLLSNIIDIYGINHTEIANYISSCNAINYIVCVGHGRTEERANSFFKEFSESKIEVIFNWNKKYYWVIEERHYVYGGDLRVLKYKN